MTEAYHIAHERIKKHVNAGPQGCNYYHRVWNDRSHCQISTDAGIKDRMVWQHEKYGKNREERPVVFITHMEHHSNHTSWYETDAEVVVIEPGKDLLVDLDHLEETLKKYQAPEKKDRIIHCLFKCYRHPDTVSRNGPADA